MYPNSIQKLIERFSKFPTVGPRTASRFVFYLLKMSDQDFNEFIETMQHTRESVKRCLLCFNTFEKQESRSEEDTCSICQDQTRDQSLLCIVEKESDLEAIEKTNQFRGKYFILGGVNGILKKEGLQGVRTKELKERIDANVQEIIFALNPTAEGEATVLYLERLLEPLNKKITRLGRGLPVGGEVEYADDETLRSAFEGRK